MAGEDKQHFTLDWWMQSPFPSGQEQPALWMDFDTIGKFHKRDKIPMWPNKHYEVMPWRMKPLSEEGNPTDSRPLTEGYCRTCARLLEFIRNLQQELKTVRNTYRGWVTIFQHRAMQAQVRASGLYGILEALAQKEAAGAGAIAAESGAPAATPAKLSITKIRGILQTDMMLISPTRNCLDNHFLSHFPTALWKAS